MAFRTLLRSSSIQEPRYPLSSVDFIHSFIYSKVKKEIKLISINQSIKKRKVIKIHQASTTCFFHQSINQSCFSSLSIKERKKERRESESTNNHPNQTRKEMKESFIP